MDIDKELYDKISEKIDIVSKIKDEIIEIHKELITNVANRLNKKYNIKNDVVFKCNDIYRGTSCGIYVKIISFVDKSDDKNIIAKYHFLDAYEGQCVYEKFIKDCNNNDIIDTFFEEINDVIFWEYF
jgi:hypothetical protein